jgi:hypothetical protein
MLKTMFVLSTIALWTSGPLRAEDRISIASDRGAVTAVLEENAAAQALIRMLPVTIEMRDLLSREKIGRLPSTLPSAMHLRNFSPGTLGVWNAQEFVIYYRTGELSSPSVVSLGQVEGDASIFDRPGPVIVKITQIKQD